MKKLRTLAELKEIVRLLKENGKTVVFTNGCFDILHVGHIRCLREAKSLGDILIVAVNSDESIAVNKGLENLFYPQDERVEILNAIEYIDYLLLFSDITVDNILLELKPSIHAKGTDYTVETVPERATVLSYGGSIAIVGDEKNHSSSLVKKEIRRSK
ncbi:MAG: adenylyltransferase/cytidyltransferase family protein [Candidatus Auribacterota bacterium]|jgi:rfaE bifunctional protein nucleotidyltransferase chain/domain|nr:adenylyltransferase/cytidyltransferase family protein [Candidatus Auribacterota bacterium]